MGIDWSGLGGRWLGKVGQPGHCKGCEWSLRNIWTNSLETNEGSSIWRTQFRCVACYHRSPSPEVFIKSVVERYPDIHCSFHMMHQLDYNFHVVFGVMVVNTKCKNRIARGQAFRYVALRLLTCADQDQMIASGTCVYAKSMRGYAVLWEELTGISSRLLKDCKRSSTRLLPSSRLPALRPADCRLEGLEWPNHLIRYRPHHSPRNFIDDIQ